MAKTVEQLEQVYSEVLDILVRNELAMNEVSYVLYLLELSFIQETVKDAVRLYMLKHNR